MQQVTNTHVKRWKEHRHEIGYGHLYQGRYKCFPVETEGYFYQVVRYVERNALHANPVERAESWRWSSLRRVEREDPAFPILSTWSLPRPTDWLQLVNQPQTEAEVAALRCCVNRGRPFGHPYWVTDTAKRLGLEWTIRPRGRPKKQSLACHSYLYYLYSPDLVAVTFSALAKPCTSSGIPTGTDRAAGPWLAPQIEGITPATKKVTYQPEARARVR
jgi:putative transposase